MTTSTLAFGKASAAGSLRLAKLQTTRCHSTGPVVAPSNGNGSHVKPADAANQRKLFMNVLSANATRRDAKQYLAQFKPPKGVSLAPSRLSPLQEERNARHRKDQDRLNRMGVNLGDLYSPARAIAESPQFTRETVEDKATVQQQVHVALVCLRAPETLDDETLDGVALTLSQLVKLDMRLLIVLDCHGADLKHIKKAFAEQGERLNRAIARHSPGGARSVNGAIEIQDLLDGSEKVAVGSPKLLLDPLKRSIIPVIPTLAYTLSGQLVQTPVSSIMPALTRLLCGRLNTTGGLSSDQSTVQTSVDRIIVLDSTGGIPSKARSDGAHVFINLEQEFRDIRAELAEYEHQYAKKKSTQGIPNVYEQHASNLEMLRDCLIILPSASSALMITPQEVAGSSQMASQNDSSIGAGTRRQKNTLIHNLLTNKPMVSSSLPVARLPHAPDSNGSATAGDMTSATLVKRGMPLTIIPAVDRSLGWQFPPSGTTSLDLETDPRVDLPRLVHLIEDSFRRKIDMQHYLDRIQNRIAGLIIAGEYEGGAILTWEQPPGTSDPSRLVPYLDKFAVLSSSQGSSGVADVLFQAMVRTCFPHGVCWRSRKDNPVNKWYFERSDGTWQIPASNWTMFWTGDGVVEDKERWEEYVGVCESVGPSWADNEKKAD